MELVGGFINSKAGHYLATIKNEIMPFAALQCMNLEIIIGMKSVRQRKTNMISLVCRI